MKLACLILLAFPLFAQRDFLTNNEIEQIREAQEPNVRLQTYVLFARQRLDQLQQQIAKDRKGRSLEIRTLLEDYSQIIDAIDTVSDDALKRKADISAGIKAVADAEQKFLVLLKKVQDSQPHDLGMYDVALKDAIGGTSDSLDTTKESIAARTQSVEAKAQREKQDLEAVTTSERAKEQKKENAKAELTEDGKPVRKPPTLYRPGEKPGEPAPQK